MNLLQSGGGKESYCSQPINHRTGGGIEVILLFTEQQWLHNAELKMYGVTKEDIDNAHGNGFMKHYSGVALYLLRINAYGNKAWGNVCYKQKLPLGFREIWNMGYVRGYRDAVKDIKKLNKKTEH